MPNNKKEKQTRRKTFRSFGAFLTSHMRRKFVRKNKKKDAVDSDALEAGFLEREKNGEGKNPPNGQNTSSKNRQTSSDTASLNEKSLLSTAIGGTFAPPGVCGLANHGATCYINAIVQCLSNTDLLAEYFVMGQYRRDLKNARKERSKKYGTNGELAENLAALIKSLWMNEYEITMTKGLKDIMCKYASQYKGNEQHDSQEFLLWLFDKVHEDLNIQPLKKNFNLKASFRRKKKVIEPTPESKELQAQLDIIPTSFIEKVFQAHFRSTLTCPNCKRQSHTTDPFLCVSLPVTQRTTRPVYINVMFLNNVKRKGEKRKQHTVKPVKQIGVAVPLDGKVLHLRQLVAAECGIHSRLLAFVEYGEDGFGTSYGDDMEISQLPQATPATSKLFAFEMPAPMKMTAGTLPRNFASRHKKRASYGDGASIVKDVLGSPDAATTLPKNIVIVLANKKLDETNTKAFGRPVIFHASKDISNNDLRTLIATKLLDRVKKGVEVEKVASILNLHVVDGLPDKSQILLKSTQPLMSQTVDTALQNCPAGGPLHIKLIAKWNSEEYCVIFDDIAQYITEEHESVRLQRLIHQQPVTCTLQECFELLTKPEELAIENSWNCPHCHKQRQGTVKKLSLYTLPDVLVVHLKRFRVVNDKRNKLNTRVDFPIMGLDMEPYLFEAARTKVSQNGHAFGIRPSVKNEDSFYDLYAVCNHFGNLNSGHYTASCLNPLDGQWYNFDDRKTELISEENLSQQSVYMLFYQRRSVNPAAPCAGGSVSSFAMSDHWAQSIQPPVRQKASSQSRLNEYAVNSTVHSPVVVKPISNGNHSVNSTAQSPVIAKPTNNGNVQRGNSVRSSKKTLSVTNGGPRSSSMTNGGPRSHSMTNDASHGSQNVSKKSSSGLHTGLQSPSVPNGSPKSSYGQYETPNSPIGAELSPKTPNGVNQHANTNNNSNRQDSRSRFNRSVAPIGRRHSGGYDLYRREKEERRSRKNNDFYPAQMEHRQIDPIGIQIPYMDRGVKYPNYEPDFRYYREAPIWNADVYPQTASPIIVSYPPMEYYSPEQQPFVRGVPRQRSVPRSVSRAERDPANTRRLSERQHRQRPSSQYEPDTYARMTYF